MNPQQTCPTCAAVIPADGADGLCLKCLGRLGFLTEEDATGDGLLRLGDYELLNEIGRGGMGVVYRARQLGLNRIVALKVLLHGPFASGEFRERFRNEARVVATLRHPNIVAVYEVGEQSGSHFIALEFIDGPSFATLARERPLPAKRAANYLKIIAEAVDYAHRNGVLHRDLTPANILLDPFDQPRVSDFGLAKLRSGDSALTVTGQILGSPSYMPPEQAAGKFSDSEPTADIYSLGAILFELLTGRPPFQGETLQFILAQVQSAEPVTPRRLNPAIPEDLQTICLKCLQKEPSRRYATARELADDLDRFLTGQPIRARPVSWPERTWLFCRRRPLLAALSAGLVLAVTLGVLGVLWEWRQAVARAAELRLNLYAADIAVASQAIQQGDFGLARRTLDALHPRPGETDLRGFEWRYLWARRRHDQLATLTGHTLAVTSVGFAPDGRLVASGSLDATVRVWDPATQKLVTNLPSARGPAWISAFTPDGKFLVTGSAGGIQFWNTQNWRHHTNFPGTLAGLSRTGDWLATSTAESPFYFEASGRISLWNWRTGVMARQFDEPGRALALSSDGALLAASVTNGITVWETATGTQRHHWPTTNSVWSLDFSPDGRHLVTAGWAREVAIWSMEGETPPRILGGHSMNVWSAAFSPDGAAIGTVSSDQTFGLWDTRTLQREATLFGHGSEVWCLAFSPDRQLIASGGKDQSVLLWPAAPAPVLPEIPNDRDFHPFLSPDGKWLLTFQPKTGRGQLWQTSDHALINANIGVGGLTVGFSRDSREVAIFDEAAGRLQFVSHTKDVSTRTVPLAGSAPAAGQFLFAEMSPDQEVFFAVHESGQIRLWDSDSGSTRQTITGPRLAAAQPDHERFHRAARQTFRTASLSAYGRYLALSLVPENFGRLYDCATGREFLLTGHRDFVSGMAFSPDGTQLATGSIDGTIRLWRTMDGTLLRELPGHMEETTDVAFSSDGLTLASVGLQNSLKLWHLPTGREVVTEHDLQTGNWVHFLPAGSTLAVGTFTNTIRLLPAPAE